MDPAKPAIIVHDVIDFACFKYAKQDIFLAISALSLQVLDALVHFAGKDGHQLTWEQSFVDSAGSGFPRSEWQKFHRAYMNVQSDVATEASHIMEEHGKFYRMVHSTATTNAKAERALAKATALPSAATCVSNLLSRQVQSAARAKTHNNSDFAVHCWIVWADRSEVDAKAHTLKANYHLDDHGVLWVDTSTMFQSIPGSLEENARLGNSNAAQARSDFADRLRLVFENCVVVSVQDINCESRDSAYGTHNMLQMLSAVMPKLSATLSARPGMDLLKEKWVNLQTLPVQEQHLRLKRGCAHEASACGALPSGHRRHRKASRRPSRPDNAAELPRSCEPVPRSVRPQEKQVFQQPQRQALAKQMKQAMLELSTAPPDPDEVVSVSHVSGAEAVAPVQETHVQAVMNQAFLDGTEHGGAACDAAAILAQATAQLAELSEWHAARQLWQPHALAQSKNVSGPEDDKAGGSLDAENAAGEVRLQEVLKACGELRLSDILEAHAVKDGTQGATELATASIVATAWWIGQLTQCAYKDVVECLSENEQAEFSLADESVVEDSMQACDSVPICDIGTAFTVVTVSLLLPHLQRILDTVPKTGVVQPDDKTRHSCSAEVGIALVHGAVLCMLRAPQPAASMRCASGRPDAARRTFHAVEVDVEGEPTSINRQSPLALRHVMHAAFSVGHRYRRRLWSKSWNWFCAGVEECFKGEPGMLHHSKVILYEPRYEALWDQHNKPEPGQPASANAAAGTVTAAHLVQPLPGLPPTADRQADSGDSLHSGVQNQAPDTQAQNQAAAKRKSLGSAQPSRGDGTKPLALGASQHGSGGIRCASGNISRGAGPAQQLTAKGAKRLMREQANCSAQGLGRRLSASQNIGQAVSQIRGKITQDYKVSKVKGKTSDVKHLHRLQPRTWPVKEINKRANRPSSSLRPSGPSGQLLTCKSRGSSLAANSGVLKSSSQPDCSLRPPPPPPSTMKRKSEVPRTVPDTPEDRRGLPSGRLPSLPRSASRASRKLDFSAEENGTIDASGLLDIPAAEVQAMAKPQKQSTIFQIRENAPGPAQRPPRPSSNPLSRSSARFPDLSQPLPVENAAAPAPLRHAFSQPVPARPIETPLGLQVPKGTSQPLPLPADCVLHTESLHPETSCEHEVPNASQDDTPGSAGIGGDLNEGTSPLRPLPRPPPCVEPATSPLSDRVQSASEAAGHAAHVSGRTAPSVFAGTAYTEDPDATPTVADVARRLFADVVHAPAALDAQAAPSQDLQHREEAQRQPHGDLRRSGSADCKRQSSQRPESSRELAAAISPDVTAQDKNADLGAAQSNEAIRDTESEQEEGAGEDEEAAEACLDADGQQPPDGVTDPNTDEGVAHGSQAPQCSRDRDDVNLAVSEADPSAPSEEQPAPDGDVPLRPQRTNTDDKGESTESGPPGLLADAVDEQGEESPCDAEDMDIDAAPATASPAAAATAACDFQPSPSATRPAVDEGASEKVTSAPAAMRSPFPGQTCAQSLADTLAPRSLRGSLQTRGGSVDRPSAVETAGAHASDQIEAAIGGSRKAVDSAAERMDGAADAAGTSTAAAGSADALSGEERRLEPETAAHEHASPPEHGETAPAEQVEQPMVKARRRTRAVPAKDTARMNLDAGLRAASSIPRDSRAAGGSGKRRPKPGADHGDGRAAAPRRNGGGDVSGVRFAAEPVDEEAAEQGGEDAGARRRSERKRRSVVMSVPDNDVEGRRRKMEEDRTRNLRHWAETRGVEADLGVKRSCSTELPGSPIRSASPVDVSQRDSAEPVNEAAVAQPDDGALAAQVGGDGSGTRRRSERARRSVVLPVPDNDVEGRRRKIAEDHERAVRQWAEARAGEALCANPVDRKRSLPCPDSNPGRRRSSATMTASPATEPPRGPKRAAKERAGKRKAVEPASASRPKRQRTLDAFTTPIPSTAQPIMRARSTRATAGQPPSRYTPDSAEVRAAPEAQAEALPAALCANTMPEPLAGEVPSELRDREPRETLPQAASCGAWSPGLQHDAGALAAAAGSPLVDARLAHAGPFVAAGTAAQEDDRAEPADMLGTDASAIPCDDRGGISCEHAEALGVSHLRQAPEAVERQHVCASDHGGSTELRSTSVLVPQDLGKAVEAALVQTQERVQGGASSPRRQRQQACERALENLDATLHGRSAPNSHGSAPMSPELDDLASPAVVAHAAPHTAQSSDKEPPSPPTDWQPGDTPQRRQLFSSGPAAGRFGHTRRALPPVSAVQSPLPPSPEPADAPAAGPSERVAATPSVALHCVTSAKNADAVCTPERPIIKEEPDSPVQMTRHTPAPVPPEPRAASREAAQAALPGTVAAAAADVRTSEAGSAAVHPPAASGDGDDADACRRLETVVEELNEARDSRLLLQGHVNAHDAKMALLRSLHNALRLLRPELAALAGGTGWRAGSDDYRVLASVQASLQGVRKGANQTLEDAMLGKSSMGAGELASGAAPRILALLAKEVHVHRQGVLKWERQVNVPAKEVRRWCVGHTTMQAWLSRRALWSALLDQLMPGAEARLSSLPTAIENGVAGLEDAFVWLGLRVIDDHGADGKTPGTLFQDCYAQLQTISGSNHDESAWTRSLAEFIVSQQPLWYAS